MSVGDVVLFARVYPPPVQHFVLVEVFDHVHLEQDVHGLVLVHLQLRRDLLSHLVAVDQHQSLPADLRVFPGFVLRPLGLVDIFAQLFNGLLIFFESHCF